MIAGAGARRPRITSTILGALFLAGVALRLLLCWANPPENTFDDHFEPIFAIMKTGSIPAKDACFQCYQPPVFYWTSAMVGKAALAAGASHEAMMKLLQFLVCGAGILTVALCYPILNRFPLSDFARVIAFGTVCLLPRHLYMSAMHGNDAFSYLLVALTVYLMLLAAERGFPGPLALAAGSAATLAVFTKHTALAVLPAMTAAIVEARRREAFRSHRQLAVAVLGAVVVPSAFLAVSMIHDVKRYGSALPTNFAIYDPSVDRPRDPEGVDYWTFKPWESLRDPVLVPGHLHSFWTLIYGGMWFDTEPYFVSELGTDERWWERYYAWYRGEGPYPGGHPPLPRTTRAMAAGLFVLGLVPAALVLVGLGVSFTGSRRRTPGLVPLTTLLAFNVAGVIALTLRLPVFNAMKASYLLISTPSFAILLAVGAARCDGHLLVRRVLAITFGALFTLAAAHAAQVTAAMLRS